MKRLTARSQQATTPDFETYAAARWTRLVRSAVLMGADLHAAEDAAQTALVRCYVSWAKVTRANDVDAYVHRVLINTLNETRRLRRSSERPLSDLPDRRLPDRSDQVDTRHELLAALGRLPLEQREAVVLRYYADFTEQQAAQALGVPVGTIKSRCSRALSALANDPALTPAKEQK